MKLLLWRFFRIYHPNPPPTPIWRCILLNCAVGKALKSAGISVIRTNHMHRPIRFLSSILQLSWWLISLKLAPKCVEQNMHRFCVQKNVAAWSCIDLSDFEVLSAVTIKFLFCFEGRGRTFLETLVNIYRTTRRYVWEDSIFWKIFLQLTPAVR